MTARWYVVHVYSGFEKKVASAIREKAAQKGFDIKKDMVDYAIATGVVVEGTKTKEKEGNGVPKGWYGGTFEDGTLRNYRFEGLTNDPVFGILKVEAMKARDARLALAPEAHD